MAAYRTSQRRSGFTLIELLVVVSIIALLIAILLPSLAGARNAAKRAVCASHLKSMGTSVVNFASQMNGRVPYSQNGPWGNPWWGNTMNALDYKILRDQCGFDPKLVSCPAAPISTRADGLKINWQWGPNWDEPTFLSDMQSMITPMAAGGWADNLAVTGGNPYYPTFHWSQAAGGGGLEAHFVQVGDYSWMGANKQYDNRIVPDVSTTLWNQYWVFTLLRPTKTGTAYDSNPPIAADQTFFQPGAPNYIFNHGTNWRINGVDPNTGAVTSMSGDVRINVLYVDGHVVAKPPDNTSYTAMGGPAYYFR
jgi:prepilin-type N-terminal cleavage/methylation domain-containing protein/prepilin-type processing-associated H-X9-DG protein